MQHFSKKAVPHARLPIFDQFSSVQNRNLFWQGPKHHQTVPIPAWIQLFRVFWTIPLLPDLCKIFFSVCYRSTTKSRIMLSPSQGQDGSWTYQIHYHCYEANLTHLPVPHLWPLRTPWVSVHACYSVSLGAWLGMVEPPWKRLDAVW